MIKDFFFRVCIDACQSVVENKDRRVADDGPGNCRALLLAAGKRKAALSDQGFIALGKALDIGCDTGRSRRRANLIVACAGNSKGNVIAYAGTE